MEKMPEVYTESEAKTTDIQILVPFPQFHNPYPVLTDDAPDKRRVIGAATLEWSSAGIVANVFIDHHTPEAFDFEVDPNLSQLRLEVAIHNGVVSGSAIIGRKS